MKRLNNYPFRGFDYTELSEAWNIPFENMDNDVKPLEYFLLSVLSNAYSDRDNTFVIKKVSKDIRLYLEKMREYSQVCYYNPIWDGLLKVESDITLIQVTIDLLKHMWN